MVGVSRGAIDPITGLLAGRTALLEACKAGITCVVITQRTSVVPALTKVMVLRDGQVEAFGPKEEVFQQQIRQATPSANPVRPAASGSPAPEGAKPSDTPQAENGGSTSMQPEPAPFQAGAARTVGSPITVTGRLGMNVASEPHR